MFKKFLYQSTSICFFSLAFVGSSSLYTAKAMTPDEEGYQRMPQKLSVNTFEKAINLFEQEGEDSPYHREIATKRLKEFCKKEGDPDQYKALAFLLRNGDENDSIFSREHLLTNLFSRDKEKKIESANVLFENSKTIHQSIGARILVEEGHKNNFRAARHLEESDLEQSEADKDLAFGFYQHFASNPKNYDSSEWDYRLAADRLWNKCKKDEQSPGREAALTAYSTLVKKESTTSNSLLEAAVNWADILHKEPQHKYKEIACDFYKSKISFREILFSIKLLESEIEECKKFALGVLRDKGLCVHLIFVYGNEEDRAKYRETLRESAKKDSRHTVEGPEAVWALSRGGNSEDEEFVRTEAHWKEKKEWTDKKYPF